MIRIDRGQPDALGAQALAGVEASALASLRALGRPPTQADLEPFDYRIAGDLLQRRQHFKCAYCENTEQRKRNDVEHFRPKSRALRTPGSPQTDGYWWLAWRWDNLLFACRNCNQSQPGGGGKLDKFPLAQGSGVLVPAQDPYGAHAAVEQTLLIDPARESGVDLIEYKRAQLAGGAERWTPIARNGSLRGAETIRVCGLDRDDLVELYNAHVETTVRPWVNAFDDMVPTTSPNQLAAQWSRIEQYLYAPGRPFVALSYDALRTLVPDDELSPHGIQRVVPR